MPADDGFRRIVKVDKHQGRQIFTTRTKVSLGEFVKFIPRGKQLMYYRVVASVVDTGEGEWRFLGREPTAVDELGQACSDDKEGVNST
jgi:hypothetical protein